LTGVLPEQSLIQVNAQRAVQSKGGNEDTQLASEKETEDDFEASAGGKGSWKMWTLFFGGLFLLMLGFIILFLVELNK